MKMRIRIAGALMFAGFTISALQSVPAIRASSIVARTDCPGKNPQAVIRSYYAAAVKGDNYGAEACLVFALASRLENVPAPDWVNLRSLHITSMRQRTVTGKKRPPGTQFEAATVEVTVHFVARYKRPLGVRNGPGTTYLYVGKDTAKSPWRINTIADRP